MSDLSDALLPADKPVEAGAENLAAKNAITQAQKQAAVIHTTLVGMMAIVIGLLSVIALPVFHQHPLTQPFVFAAMVVLAVSGISYLYLQNLKIHKSVSSQARLTEVLVNSLGQGFLSFDIQGNCGPVYSQACLDLLETDPSGKGIADVLKVPEDQRVDFRDWLDVLFMPNHALSFEDVVRFLPQSFVHSQGRRVSLLYRPIRDNAGALVQVVVIATDRTEEHEAQLQAQKQQGYANMICGIFKERNQFLATLTQIRKFLEILPENVRRENAPPILRLLHTLKAAVKHFHMDDLGDVVRQLENDLRADQINSDDEFRKQLKVGQNKIQENLNLIMALVRDLIGQDYEGMGNTYEIAEGTLYDFVADMRARHADPELIKIYLKKIAAAPINDSFRSFERELRDLCEITGKQVKPVRFTGSNPRILTKALQEFIFSLTHICRNIIDHGIEPSVMRISNGKDPFGQVSIHSDVVLDDVSGQELLHIIISDDGAGIDPARVRAKLASTDPQGAWRNQDDHAVIQNIFSWGFSTRDNVTDLSGRGVGMEVVEREVKNLGGRIEVFSQINQGTRFDIKIPYSLELPEDREKTNGAKSGTA